MKVLIKKGSTSVETSLKELEEKYAQKLERKLIEWGGVLSVPVEEFRMINPPKPGREGEYKFVEKTGKGKRNLIESYPISLGLAADLAACGRDCFQKNVEQT